MPANRIQQQGRSEMGQGSRYASLQEGLLGGDGMRLSLRGILQWTLRILQGLSKAGERRPDCGSRSLIASMFIFNCKRVSHS